MYRLRKSDLELVLIGLTQIRTPQNTEQVNELMEFFESFYQTCYCESCGAKPCHCEQVQDELKEIYNEN